MSIKLKPPHFKPSNLGDLLEKRYSGRSFKAKSLNLGDLSTILWATAGEKHNAVTSATRTIPSAGATYPLELYLVVGENGVDKLEKGVYHYLIAEHALELIGKEDKRQALVQACLGQSFIEEAPVSLVITAKFSRTTQRYGRRGERYVLIEAGHASQNTYLAVSDLGLGTVEVGAFMDDAVQQVLGLKEDSLPLVVMPIGYSKSWGK